MRSFISTPLLKSHDRTQFDCQKESLNHYIKFQVSQDVKKKLAVCFVLPSLHGNTIDGYYTLASGNIPYTHVPSKLRQKYPKSYDYIPVTLLGRLALDKRVTGQGIGGKLLIDALKRCLKVAEEEIGSVAVIVDPLDEDAESYYQHYGFTKLPDRGKMFLDMKTIKQLNL
jgi:GNAT superfamily N-acetyltransferase